MSFLSGLLNPVNTVASNLFGGGAKPPPTPDYAGAAQATAAGNRVNQVTPYGSLTYSNPNPKDVNSPWTATTTLSPEQQQLLKQQTGLQGGLMSLAGGMLPQLKDAMSHQISMADLPASPVNPGQTGQDALMERFQPMMDQSNKQLDQQLANQGIMPGSEAYDNAWRTQNQGNNDLRMQAALEGINVGENAQNQQYGLKSAMQEQPFNLMAALRQGTGVTNPQFTSTPAGPDYMGATSAASNYNLGTYNARQAQQNALMGGLFGLGSAAILK